MAIQGKKIYMASKTKHADKWITFRSYGFNIISTWIDEAGEGESTDLEDLCRRCVTECLACDAMIVYSESGDYLKGAFIEMGIALSKSKPVFLVGDPLPAGSAFTCDPNVYKANSVEHALDIIKNQYDWSAPLSSVSGPIEREGWVSESEIMKALKLSRECLASLELPEHPQYEAVFSIIDDAIAGRQELEKYVVEFINEMRRSHSVTLRNIDVSNECKKELLLMAGISPENYIGH